ncbi:MAG TPA: aminotransferase class V-fold PLP-dependent enzyme [Cyclobacteriaceae bacterium]|nr:aminotransferase class V-fold PLP-dependent enzyme [Cyclobacteriaceae bacterium]HMV10284.1 aminotransferase class V-fold PLP-dependent enzyme [Cyclobacteriaceae bacterium]HMV89648.1 aminotransferase class V-fold PLP-dependent enzyme [Cyclobacteriaceae bacterium]HMW99764.1 aminotransferase class V-fold PLP-dependent enzyme [Cyclobacteriaceae bacterium]HMX50156.1 aminotransferase class V-fold PLP-dependent enzyme [Cyclobacteriaceae bacterium]
MDKRTFLQHSLALGAAAFMPRIAVGEWLEQHQSYSPAALASDEKFWAGIRKGYKLKPDYINLENGYYCFLPQETLDKYLDHIREVNMQGSYYMRTVQVENKKKVVAKLAELAGCSTAEIAITRNTTESLDTVINGIHWNAGDEAVMAEQDYGSIVNQFKLMEKRYGIVAKVLSVPNHPASDEEIVELYRKAITPKTKLLLVSHMINITGQVLPIKKISDMAHSLNVDVAVDGAHAFAHLNFRIPDLGCDYYATSLHKWLSVPLGSGLLYIREGKAPGLWSLMADWNMKDDITHLAHTGTHPVATDLTILDAIDFYQKLGPERKEARLQYLQNYWTSRVRSNKNIVLNTPEDPKRSCGIANVGIQNMTPADMAKTLLTKYKIWTVAIDGQGVRGCRITPNVYTTTAELDAFVKALTEMAG